MSVQPPKPECTQGLSFYSYYINIYYIIIYIIYVRMFYVLSPSKTNDDDDDGG